MNRFRGDRSGVALMLVLWLIVLLATVSSGVLIATRSTTLVVANYRARTVARYAAESGVIAAVTTLEQNLSRMVDPGERRAFLNQLDQVLGSGDITMGSARVRVVLVDVGTRLDVNLVGVPALTQLFSFFTDAIEAEVAARAIEAHIGGVAGGTNDFSGPGTARPLRSLDELAGIPGVPAALTERAASFLTVDGDGTINRATASDTVLASARGEVRDEPSRILVVSRGWLDGHALSHEIQAVYALVGSQLTLVKWRERPL